MNRSRRRWNGSREGGEVLRKKRDWGTICIDSRSRSGSMEEPERPEAGKGELSPSHKSNTVGVF